MKTIRVVLDTNVVVSAHLNDQGYERHVLDLALANKIRLVASETFLAEYENVLYRPKFAIAPKHLRKTMRLLRSVAHLVNPQYELMVTQDADGRR